MTVDAVVYAIEVSLFCYFFATNATYLATTAIALANLRDFVRLHRADPVRFVYSEREPPVTVLVPAYDEEEGILETVASLLAQRYSQYEVVVVNDGSTDATLALLTEAYALEPFPEAQRAVLATKPVRGVYRSRSDPRLRVIDKENGGKGDALNAGINAARYPLFFACDGDSYYSADALSCLIEPFVRDPRTVASGGAIGVSNACRFADGRLAEKRLSPRWIVRFQVLEYMRAFLSSRLGWAPCNALCIVSGACGLYRKATVVEAGGYRTDIVWEDMEMTLRVHHLYRSTGRPYRIAFTPFVVCWTRVPSTLRELWGQRVSWHRHVSECMTIHRDLFLRPSAGTVGMLAFPYLAFGEWLAPLAVIFGIGFGCAAAWLGFISWSSQAILLALVFALGLAETLASMLLDEFSFNTYRFGDVVRLLGSSLWEFCGYRQFLTVANFVGLIHWARGAPLRGKPARPGWELAPYRPAKGRG